MVEQCWSRLEKRVVVGEHYASFEDLRRAASEFMRTARFDLSLEDYLYASRLPTLRPRKRAAAEGGRSPRGAAVRACAYTSPAPPPPGLWGGGEGGAKQGAAGIPPRLRRPLPLSGKDWGALLATAALLRRPGA